MVLVLVALVGVFLSSYLALYKLGYIGHLACAAGTCERVQSSRWSILFGVPVAAWGVAFYVTTLIIAVAGTLPGRTAARPIAWALLALTGWGLVFSAYLTALELFVIHAICEYCVSSAVLVLVMFCLALADLRDRPPAGADEGPGADDGPIPGASATR